MRGGGAFGFDESPVKHVIACPAPDCCVHDVFFVLEAGQDVGEGWLALN